MRVLNRLLAALLSLALMVGGVLVIVEVIAALTGQGPVWWDWQATRRWAERTSWEDTLVRIVCVVAFVVGAILLVAELKRPRVRRFRVARATTDPRTTDTAYTRGGVAAAVRSAVARIDGIRGVRVAVKHRTVKVVATVGSQNRAFLREVGETATEAARDSVDRLGLRGSPSVSVRTRSA